MRTVAVRSPEYSRRRSSPTPARSNARLITCPPSSAPTPPTNCGPTPSRAATYAAMAGAPLAQGPGGRGGAAGRRRVVGLPGVGAVGAQVTLVGHDRLTDDKGRRPLLSGTD